MQVFRLQCRALYTLFTVFVKHKVSSLFLCRALVQGLQFPCSAACDDFPPNSLTVPVVRYISIVEGEGKWKQVYGCGLHSGTLC